MLNGELDANELALLRTHPQRTDIYLALPEYTTEYAGEVETAPVAGNDGVFEFDVHNLSAGLLTNCVSGMTVWIGSAPGLYDIGVARLRDSTAHGPSWDHGDGTGTLYIGTTSEIPFATPPPIQYVTVLNEFGLWPRHPYVDPVAGTVYMDRDIPHTNQHIYFDPVPVFGPHVVIELVGGTAVVAFDASLSYSCAEPASVLSYVWWCAGAVVSSPATATTNITFSTAGTYRVRLMLTATYGAITKTTTAYRYVIVHDVENPLIKAPVLESCEGDYDTGGWSYRVTLHSEATRTNIRDRQLCILVAKDWYGDTQQSIGPIAGRENIVCVGWIDGESITRSNDTGDVSFDVQGPHFWLEKMPGYPTGVDDKTSAPTAWTEIEKLTIRKGVWHFLHWRTTTTTIMDIPMLCPTWEIATPRRLATTYTPAGSLSEQLRAIADRIFARAICDRYGRIYCDVDPQITSLANRVYPDVYSQSPDMADTDWRDNITIERRTISETAIADVSGIFWSGAVAGSMALFALSPGHYYKHYGRSEKRDRLSLLDQAQATELAGLYSGWLNNEYPNVDIPFAANVRAFDIAPAMWLTMNIATGDTPRGIVWTNKRLIPRRISLERDEQSAIMLTDGTFEAETFALDGVTGDAPLLPPDPPEPPGPPDPWTPPLPENKDLVVVMTKNQIKYATDFFTSLTPTWTNIVDANLALAGTFYQVVVRTSGEAWLVTHGNGVSDKGTNGLWHCTNIIAPTPTWALICSENWIAARSSSGAGWLPTVVIESGGTVWAPVFGGFADPAYSTVGWFTGTIAGMAWGWRKFLPAWANNKYDAGQWSACATAADDIMIGMRFIGSGGGRYASLKSGVNIIANAAGSNNFPVVGLDGYLIGAANEVGPVWISPALNGGSEVYLDADGTRPIARLGATLWTDYTDQYLMTDGPVEVARPNGVDPVGAFSTASASGGSYVYVNDTSHIIWIARTASATNSKRSIAYTVDGGVNWLTKDGDFGVYNGGILTIRPVVRYLKI
jgi:PKD repeat protein